MEDVVVFDAVKTGLNNSIKSHLDILDWATQETQERILNETERVAAGEGDRKSFVEFYRDRLRTIEMVRELFEKTTGLIGDLPTVEEWKRRQVAMVEFSKKDVVLEKTIE